MSTFSGAAAPSSCLDASNRMGLTTTVYDGPTRKVTDPAGHQRDYSEDGLGRIVDESADGARPAMRRTGGWPR